MGSAWAQLDKLRGRSLRELRVRGAQQCAKWSERWLGRNTTELSDEQLLRELAGDYASADAAATVVLARLSNPARQRFFPALAERAAIIELMEMRFPRERAAVIERAERVCANRFDIFEREGLSYGDPPDWHYEPIAGKRAPFAHWSEIDFLDPAVAGDKKFIWELNRCQFFVTLGQAYWLTGDERYAAKFVELASSWLDANPPKRGVNWASSLEAALRVIAWLWALHLFAEAVAPRFVARLLKALLAHGRHVETYLSHYFSPNTHLTGEALGLFYLGAALPELKRSAHWRELGLQILLEQLPRQVRNDGVYFEQASYYHRYTTDFYLHLLLLARAGKRELPPLVEEKLTGLLDHLLWITRPDGSVTFYGDDDGGRLVGLSARQAGDFRDTLALGAALFQRGDWKLAAGEAALETLWLLGPQGLREFDATEARAPEATRKAFADSGFYVLRDGWQRDSSFLLIDCGLHGAMNCGHAHSDALAFEFAAGGVNWLVDPGTFTYTGDANLRVEATSSIGHNTLVVDGASQSVKTGAFTWSHVAHSFPLEFKQTDDGWLFTGRQNGYLRLSDPVYHQRAFNLRKGRELPPYLVIADQITAKAQHRYELRFHFSAGLQAEVNGDRFHLTAPGGDELILVTIMAAAHSEAKLALRLETGWVSRCYGKRASAPLAITTTEMRGSGKLLTLIAPFHHGQRAEIERFVAHWLRTAGLNRAATNGEQLLAALV